MRALLPVLFLLAPCRSQLSHELTKLQRQGVQTPHILFMVPEAPHPAEGGPEGSEEVASSEERRPDQDQAVFVPFAEGSPGLVRFEQRPAPEETHPLPEHGPPFVQEAPDFLGPVVRQGPYARPPHRAVVPGVQRQPRPPDIVFHPPSHGPNQGPSEGTEEEGEPHQPRLIPRLNHPLDPNAGPPTVYQVAPPPQQHPGPGPGPGAPGLGPHIIIQGPLPDGREDNVHPHVIVQGPYRPIFIPGAQPPPQQPPQQQQPPSTDPRVQPQAPTGQDFVILRIFNESSSQPELISENPEGAPKVLIVENNGTKHNASVQRIPNQGSVESNEPRLVLPVAEIAESADIVGGLSEDADKGQTSGGDGQQPSSSSSSESVEEPALSRGAAIDTKDASRSTEKPPTTAGTTPTQSTDAPAASSTSTSTSSSNSTSAPTTKPTDTRKDAVIVFMSNGPLMPPVKTTSNEEPKPDGEASKPVGETSKPVEGASKSVEEASKPVEETSKPVEEASKPVEGASKPVEEASRPVGEASKPVEEASKPIEEASRPVGETLKPVGETSKPVGEVSTPDGKAPKPVEEVSRPIEKSSFPSGPPVSPALHPESGSPSELEPVVIVWSETPVDVSTTPTTTTTTTTTPSTPPTSTTTTMTTPSAEDIEKSSSPAVSGHSITIGPNGQVSVSLTDATAEQPKTVPSFATSAKTAPTIELTSSTNESIPPAPAHPTPLSGSHGPTMIDERPKGEHSTTTTTTAATQPAVSFTPDRNPTSSASSVSTADPSTRTESTTATSVVSSTEPSTTTSSTTTTTAPTTTTTTTTAWPTSSSSSSSANPATFPTSNVPTTSPTTVTTNLTAAPTTTTTTTTTTSTTRTTSDLPIVSASTEQTSSVAPSTTTSSSSTSSSTTTSAPTTSSTTLITSTTSTTAATPTTAPSSASSSPEAAVDEVVRSELPILSSSVSPSPAYVPTEAGIVELSSPEVTANEINETVNVPETTVVFSGGDSVRTEPPAPIDVSYRPRWQPSPSPTPSSTPPHRPPPPQPQQPSLPPSTTTPQVVTVGPPKYYELPSEKDKPSVFPTQTIRTRNGQMKGNVIKTSSGVRVNSFLGIPYAQPPLGAMRFERPMEFPPWTGVFEAKRLPKSCPQPSMQLNGFVGVNISDTSEDCLYLNIWSPFCDGSKKCRSRPVVVYIHGGGFVHGGVNWPIFDGAELAAKADVLVVTLNYRLGALGFLYVPSNGGRPERANMGLYDQHLALRWVKSNIKAFGGDHNKITIMGQDAGSASVGYHILTPRSTGLFKRAVMQSGSPFSFVLRNTKDEGETLFRSLASYTDCTSVYFNSTLRYDDVLQCMKKLPFENIIAAAEKFNGRGANSFFPIVGEEFIPMSPKDSLLLKRFSNVDLLVTTTRSEGAFFLQHFLSPFTNVADPDRINPGEIVFYLRVFLSALLGGKPTASLNELTQNTEPETREERIQFLKNISAVIGDYPFLCATTEFGSDYANLRHNVYHMQYDHRPWFLLHPTWFPSTHGDDIMFWLGSVYKLKERTRADERVADELMAILTAFAAKGTPQTRGKLTWPRINQGGYYMSVGSETTELLRNPPSNCRHWSRHYPQF